MVCHRHLEAKKALPKLSQTLNEEEPSAAVTQHHKSKSNHPQDNR